jgi:hypothetical protein
MTYFEVEDIRPGTEQGQANPEENFVSTPRGISIPGELNQNILQFGTRKRYLLRFAMVSKTVERVVMTCKALIFDAIQERINEFINQNGR